MTDRPDPTPAALYARVSSDRQNIDLSVSARLRALHYYAGRDSYAVAFKSILRRRGIRVTSITGRAHGSPLLRSEYRRADRPDGEPSTQRLPAPNRPKFGQ